MPRMRLALNVMPVTRPLASRTNWSVPPPAVNVPGIAGAGGDTESGEHR
jgi:hypothetical protein